MTLLALLWNPWEVETHIPFKLQTGGFGVWTYKIYNEFEKQVRPLQRQEVSNSADGAVFRAASLGCVASCLWASIHHLEDIIACGEKWMTWHARKNAQSYCTQWCAQTFPCVVRIVPYQMKKFISFSHWLCRQCLIILILMIYINKFMNHKI